MEGMRIFRSRARGCNACRRRSSQWHLGCQRCGMRCLALGCRCTLFQRGEPAISDPFPSVNINLFFFFSFLGKAMCVPYVWCELSSSLYNKIYTMKPHLWYRPILSRINETFPTNFLYIISPITMASIVVPGGRGTKQTMLLDASLFSRPFIHSSQSVADPFIHSS